MWVLRDACCTCILLCLLCLGHVVVVRACICWRHAVCMVHLIHVVHGAFSCLCGWCTSVRCSGHVCRVKGPTRNEGVPKVGFLGPAEDLRPVSEVEAGVNSRPAGVLREAGCRFTSQEATRNWYQEGHRVGVDTPSLHPEVPGIQFVSFGYGLDIRQSMGWTKVCGTTRSGLWVLKGNARTCLLPCQS